MKHFTISNNGSKNYNEDILFADDNNAWTIDGATGLSKDNLTSFPSDACWFVSKWNDFLKNNINKINNNDELKILLKEGIKEITNFFKDLSKDKDVKEIAKPSAAISIVYIRENKLHYFSLGDTSILIKKHDDTIMKIKQTLLEKLDDIAVKEMVLKRKNLNISLSEARKNIDDTLIRHRLMKNTKDGYWTLSFNLDAIDNAIEGTLNLNEVKSVLIMSDGFSCIFDTYKYCSESELFDLVEKKGLRYAYEKIRLIENQDSEAIKFPRFKKSDDSSCIYLK